MNTSSPATCPQCGKLLPPDAPRGICPSCVMAMNLSPETMQTGGRQSMLYSLEEVAGRFNQYEILECLGRGGMGVVYKARQKALDREVAIKVLAGEWQDDPSFANRFEHEAKLLAQMSHPNIVTVHDFGEVDGLYYIVMEYVAGVNLRDLLSDGKMAPDQALAIVPPICEALEYAHKKGVVHRDIKPENLLLDRDGRVKIADFGIASLVGATSDISGTPSYMAPEQHHGSVDRRADIYALGVVLYEMLTGERPGKDIVAPSNKVEVDVKIDEMVLRALEKEPERRYQSAREFCTTAELAMHTPARVAAGARPAHSTSNSAGNPWSRRFFWLVATLLGTPVLWFLAMLLLWPAAEVGATNSQASSWIAGAAILGLASLVSPAMLLLSFRHHRSEDALPTDGVARWSLGLMIAALLGTPLLFALVPGGRHEWVLVFAGMCALGSVACGAASYRTRLGRGVLLGWLALAFIPLMPIALYWNASLEDGRRAQAQTNLEEIKTGFLIKQRLADQAPANNVSLEEFGPERSVVLVDVDNANTSGDRFLDLDTESTSFGPPQSSRLSDKDIVRWMSGGGFDLCADKVGDKWGIATRQLELFRLPADQYLNADLGLVKEVIARGDTGLQKDDDADEQGWTGYFLPGPLPENFTLAFQTADGGIGVMQIDEGTAADGEKSLRFRYKLAVAPDGKETPQPDEAADPRVVAEQQFIMPGNALVRLVLLENHKGLSQRTVAHPFYFRTAEDRATGFVVRCSIVPTNQKGTDKARIELIDPDTDVVMHIRDIELANELRWKSPDIKPRRTDNKNILITDLGSHTSIRLLRGEAPAKPKHPITEWGDVFLKVSYALPRAEKTEPAFQMPTLGAKEENDAANTEKTEHAKQPENPFVGRWRWHDENAHPQWVDFVIKPGGNVRAQVWDDGERFEHNGAWRMDGDQIVIHAMGPQTMHGTLTGNDRLVMINPIAPGKRVFHRIAIDAPEPTIESTEPVPEDEGIAPEDEPAKETQAEDVGRL